jgi:hypothetical protein
MAKEKTRGQGRTRGFNLIVYPESAPENWRSILDELHIAWVESPLHDLDVNPDGEVKKAHYHVTLIFDSVKDIEQVKEITDLLNGPHPQKCNSIRGSIRYMVHMDNPEKYQYDKSKIIAHGGADVAELLKPSNSERYSLIAEMMTFCDENEITEFVDLTKYAIQYRFDDWFPLLCDSAAYVIGQYLKSKRFKNERYDSRAPKGSFTPVMSNSGEADARQSQGFDSESLRKDT